MKHIMATVLLGALGLALAACIVEEPGWHGGYHGGYEHHEGFRGDGDHDHWH